MPSIVIAVAAAVLALGSGCSLYGDDAPIEYHDAPPIDEPCLEPNPGCPSREECSPACGDAVYACAEGEWVQTVACDTCLGRIPKYPGTWSFTQTLDPAPPCAVEVRAEVMLAAGPPEIAGDYAALVPSDPAIQIEASTGTTVPGSPACAEAITVSLTDTVRLDTVAATAAITWQLRLADSFTATTIDGRFTGTVDGCTFSGSIRGSYTLPLAP